jgi:hypothetical protein
MKISSCHVIDEGKFIGSHIKECPQRISLSYLFRDQGRAKNSLFTDKHTHAHTDDDDDGCACSAGDIKSRFSTRA